MPKPEPRRCMQCGAPMDRRREDDICGPCLTRDRIGSLAPTTPPELLRDPALISAITRRDMGAVSRIHRAYTGSSQGDMAAILDLTQPDISKIENDARVVTELELFIQMVNALGIPPQLTLQAIYGSERSEGAASTPGLRPDDGDDVLRRSLLLGSAFAATAVVAPELLGRADRDGGRRVGATEVAAVQQMAAQFRNLDRRLGGRRVKPLIIDYLTTTVHSYLRSGTSSERTRKAMFAAAADLTRLAGWVAFDAGDMQADRYLTQAVTLAELASDKALSADVLVPMGNDVVRD
jgi:DNA-binding XRE family transcriptional regulator